MPAESESGALIRASRPDELTDVLELWRESRGWTGKTDDLASLGALIERDRSHCWSPNLTAGSSDH